MKNTKFKLLRKSILYDLVGMATMFIPVVGPFLDLIWAPIAAKAVVFIEEILPFDFIPTFTLMWLYTYVFSNEKQQTTPQTIEVKVNE